LKLRDGCMWLWWVVLLGQFNGKGRYFMRLPEDDPKYGPETCSNYQIKSMWSSSIGLFLLLCWRPNPTNHDRQQDANNEDQIGHNRILSRTIILSITELTTKIPSNMKDDHQDHNKHHKSHFQGFITHFLHIFYEILSPGSFQALSHMITRILPHVEKQTLLGTLHFCKLLQTCPSGHVQIYHRRIQTQLKSLTWRTQSLQWYYVFCH
jgi:hypothetical protein